MGWIGVKGANRLTDPAPRKLTTARRLPLPSVERQPYRMVCDRASHPVALISLAGTTDVDQDCISSPTLAFGNLATMPWRDGFAEALLIGKAPVPGLFERVADAVHAGARGSGESDSKIPMCKRSLVTTSPSLGQDGAQ